MRRTAASLTAVLAAAIWLSGCGGSSSGPSTFIGHGQSSATAISWTDDGSGHLTGSVQIVIPNPDGSGDVVKTENVPFSGTLHAGQISIVVVGLLGVTATWTGDLSGDTLSLNIPQADGSIAPDTLARGKISDFNSAVSELRNQVSQARAKAAADAAVAADAQVSAAAATAAELAQTEADDKVSNAMDVLQQSIADGLSFGAFSGDLATLKRDLEVTRSDALKATTAGAGARANGDACGDASTAQGDASTVGGDESTIGGDESTAQVTIDSLSQQSQDLRDAQTAMEAVYRQQGLSPGSEAPILDALHQANTTIKAWKARIADYVATAHKLAAQATQIADAAAKAVC
ncbi:MAG: hypothetical protein ACOH1Y_14285 [Propionicimonas sp.]